MAEDDRYASWERRRDAERQAEWRRGIDEWRKFVDGRLNEIRESQIERDARRTGVRDFFTVARNWFLLFTALGSAGILAWQAFVALVRGAGNG